MFSIFVTLTSTVSICGKFRMTLSKSLSRMASYSCIDYGIVNPDHVIILTDYLFCYLFIFHYIHRLIIIIIKTTFEQRNFIAYVPLTVGAKKLIKLHIIAITIILLVRSS